MKQAISLFLKGLAMGAANVIPGVSGGTIALITGIYETFINSLKSFDLDAIKLLFQFKFKELWEHVNGSFLSAVLLGVGVSIFSLAKILEYLLANQELLTMAFFFGLIAVSVYSVGRTVKKWSLSSVITLLIGTGIAVGIALLAPATENASFVYVVLCGVVAVCSMILPGLSGSFVLIIMGNYALILGAIGRVDLGILAPLMVGVIVGMITFSQLISWVLKRYPDQTIGMMTGFVLGSLLVIWPWKTTMTETIERVGKEAKEVVVGYDWHLPDFGAGTTYTAMGLIVIGGVLIWLIDRSGNMKEA
jgi:putative membrane protein